MNHTEVLTRYVTNFVDELVANGLTDAVISPGSRSTPLALTLAEHKKMKEWVIIDERSAAFFALGLAKKTKRPVILVCTSGTATANYFPAIVEAYYSRVPLIVLTADRPHELRDVGAPQAIDQIKMYGDYVKWFHEMALPEAAPHMLQYVRNKAASACYMALEGNPGVVHLNFPFREPLMVDFQYENVWGIHERSHPTSILPAYEGKKHLSKQQMEEILLKLANKEKGVLVCGPQTDPELPEAITTLAKKWEIPILADPLSQVRAGSHVSDVIIESYDALLRNEAIRERLKPEFIIRFGAMPVSKAYSFYVKQHPHAMQIVVEDYEGFREPTSTSTTFIFADAVECCQDFAASATLKGSKTWLQIWKQYNEIAKKHLNYKPDQELKEGEAVRTLLETTPEKSCIFVGNSMAVRDLDSFFWTTKKQIEVLANRGANGIDGVVSSGLGACAAGSRVTLVLGDLSFFHDMNGLHAAMHYQLPLTILLINNNGGGIFSFLSQANDKQHFESLFGTPLNIDFKHAVHMYGGQYVLAKTELEVREALLESYQQAGLVVVEVKTNREVNALWHREKWQAIEQEIVGERN
ncbi:MULTISPECIES: 2-succinyl-5-enolpyruvyl-6-hydroxy-3-cyclohexene-1-carboxylic-acid synthase [Clostridia]|uniref:2-succinyl-5-enolpyruvyl-6-hydroxy-3- cyclohexene-1-carboxylic-acid synthase n=1 Tax=Clostridia TaxID=186801 RepID=UPI000EA0CDBA|nr:MULTISPECIES: 2-succinyl-5-enolpyruvyl-6-hydroxy-3-cyclohexene-1-carboxylic-acid synthase [Clostridia]NBJ69285.1 2-succinyl-5-enolpyruvyl-6-hydroxy-3-cyclohexene-1-carboxylic-acid synthase [Roseburia sp. 1XD42-34]RKI79250.1 2-succinyl-5-enolpyruvyl-6-hydroxy-3-cyclohexene-1-carboxylic-acid synthase [Clostridium sp. 1xD42-85]